MYANLDIQEQVVKLHHTYNPSLSHVLEVFLTIQVLAMEMEFVLQTILALVILDLLAQNVKLQFAMEYLVTVQTLATMEMVFAQHLILVIVILDLQEIYVIPQYATLNLEIAQMFVTTATVHVFLQIHVTVTVDMLEVNVAFQFVTTNLLT